MQTGNHPNCSTVAPAGRLFPEEGITRTELSVESKFELPAKFEFEFPAISGISIALSSLPESASKTRTRPFEEATKKQLAGEEEASPRQLLAEDTSASTRHCVMLNLRCGITVKSTAYWRSNLTYDNMTSFYQHLIRKSLYRVLSQGRAELRAFPHYRVTIQVVSNHPLTPKQRLRFCKWT